MTEDTATNQVYNQQAIDDFFARLPRDGSDMAGPPRIRVTFADGAYFQAKFLAMNAIGILLIAEMGVPEFYPWSAIYKLG